MSTMAAYRIPGWGRPARLDEVPVPEPGPGQVRVRVAGCGLCHSDLTMAHVTAEMGAAMGWRVPFTLGHESAGWVDAVGPGVERWSGGEPVAVASPASCGRCRWCRRGEENACSHGLVGRGYGRDGGLAEFVLVDDADRVLVALGSLSPETAGPLTDAGATAHHAVRRVARRVHADAAVVVFGVGGLGAMAVQLAATLTPGRLIAVDPDPDRRRRALELGAHAAVAGVDDDSVEAIRAACEGDPIDAVIDIVGTDTTILTATSLVVPGGALALVGAAGGTLRRPWFPTLPRDAEVFTFQNSDLADLRAVVELAAEGRLTVDVVPYPLERAAQAYADLDAGAVRGRALVHP